jgi:hypothetical protein
MNQKEELAVVGDELTIMIKKNEILLEKIFPARIVRCLRDNKPVKPDSFDDATNQERGEIEVKNGGIIKTFWLLSASQKHPKINDDYINGIRSKGERLLHHKFSALRAKKSMLGLMFESDKSNDTIELHHSMLTSVKKMSGSFRVTTSNLSESDRGSVSSNFSVRTLAIVGNITIRGDEHAWDISYMNDLDCYLNEIDYGNTYSAILIDLDCSDSIRTDFALFKKKLEDMHYNNSLIIGLTNNYLEADAMKAELEISILVKPLDFQIFNKIFSSYQLHNNLLHD